MIGALIIVLREVVEAGLIVGIVLAVTQNVPHRLTYVVAGILGGLAGAGLVALFAGRLAALLEGNGQEVFNAAILGIAVVMLAWHNIWMARHGREMAAEMRTYGQQVKSGTRSLAALAVVVAVAVMREGSEVVLFLYGLAASARDTGASLLIGSGLGLVAGVAVSSLTFLGLVVIPTRYLFGVTTTLITFLAAGLAAQSVVFLQQAGVVTSLSQTAWDTSAYLSDTSLIGRVFHTLVGYSDQPSVLQVAVYAATLIVIFALSRLFSPQPRPGIAAAH